MVPHQKTPSEKPSRSVCPNCGGGWTFDFAQRRVYCRMCEASAAKPSSGNDEAQDSAS
jgi:ribosomal protein S27E